MRLNDDWEGADFIAINDKEMIKVQLKGRFSIDKKYLGKTCSLPLLSKIKLKFIFTMKR